MFANLSTLTAREIKIGLRNHFFSILLLLAVIYILTIFFAIPEELVMDPVIYYADESGADVLDKALADFKGSKFKLDSDEQVKQKLQDENYAWGLVAQKGEKAPQIQYLFQGWEDPKLKNLMVVTIEDYLAKNYLQMDNAYAIEKIGMQGYIKPPFNKFLVPMFLFSEVFMIGMFFIAALIFIEKDEGTLKAFLVTPSKIGQYLLAKVVMMAVLAVFFTLLLALPTLGLQPDYLQLLVLVVLGSCFTSLLGLIVASYFSNLSQFLFPAVLVLGVFTLPTASYIFPSFSPDFITWLPTYDLIFGLRQAAFSLGQEEVVVKGIVTFVIYDVILFYLAKMRFSQQKLWN
ncbi:MAG: ABC transporter permease [Bacillota bacterium]